MFDLKGEEDVAETRNRPYSGALEAHSWTAIGSVDKGSSGVGDEDCRRIFCRCAPWFGRGLVLALGGDLTGSGKLPAAADAS